MRFLPKRIAMPVLFSTALSTFSVTSVTSLWSGRLKMLFSATYLTKASRPDGNPDMETTLKPPPSAGATVGGRSVVGGGGGGGGAEPGVSNGS
jgi:hypothetical protein